MKAFYRKIENANWDDKYHFSCDCRKPSSENIWRRAIKKHCRNEMDRFDRLAEKDNNNF